MKKTGRIDVPCDGRTLSAEYKVHRQGKAGSGTPRYVGELSGIYDEEGSLMEEAVSNKLIRMVTAEVQRRVRAETGHPTIQLILATGAQVTKKPSVLPYPTWVPGDMDFGQDVGPATDMQIPPDANETTGSTQDGITRGRMKNAKPSSTQSPLPYPRPRPPSSTNPL